MEVRCTICGKVEKLSKMHKDYKKLQTDPGAVYICETCNIRLSAQAFNDKRS